MVNSSELLAAFGTFHPLVIHLPIGLIAGVTCLELWVAFRAKRGTDLRASTGVLLALAGASAIIAVACGLLLARSGGYEAELLDRHRFFGIVAAALTVVALLLHRRARRSGRRSTAVLYRSTLAVSVVAIGVAGYYGGAMAHGRTPFAILVDALRGGSSGDAVAFQGDGAFHDTVGPILESHCYECHGAEKQKNGLRLDSRDAALTGGDSGKPAVVPGNAMQSRLVEAITLPAGNKRAMPPAGKPRLEPAQVLALIDWINRGAVWPDKGQLFPKGVAPPPAAALEQLRNQGFRLDRLASRHPLVRVDRVPEGARLAALAPLAPHVAWLSLPGFRFEPGEISGLGDMPYLTRLELQGSNVQDADLAQVAKVPQLAVLNLYGTQIGDSGLDHLRGLASLQRLYLWQTQVTAAGVQRLHEALPNLQIDDGNVENALPDSRVAPSPAA